MSVCICVRGVSVRERGREAGRRTETCRDRGGEKQAERDRDGETEKSQQREADGVEGVCVHVCVSVCV